MFGGGRASKSLPHTSGKHTRPLGALTAVLFANDLFEGKSRRGYCQPLAQSAADQ